MVRKFLRDIRGSYMLMTAIAMVPIMGGLALAVDFAEMNRQRQATMNALDAAGIATGYRFAQGATDAEIKAYAKDFFEANLGPVKSEDTVLTIVLPNSPSGGGMLKMSADLVYKPYFYPAFASMVNAGSTENSTEISFSAQTEVRLKNTLEVALVLDNSGSMDFKGTGSGQKRLDLLKVAAKQLVDTISKQGAQMKQVDKPVQFALVPFAASVNVGPENAGQPWMDRDGVSPVHYENFDLPAVLANNKKIKFKNGYIRKTGAGWGDERNDIVTRFSLFEELRIYTNSERTETKAYAQWGGCVEARPAPYNTSDFSPAAGVPASYFVPMFAPDEWDYEYNDRTYSSRFHWWKDRAAESTWPGRQRDLVKYFTPARRGTDAADNDEGPNDGCTTKPITPLVNVSTSAGLTAIKDAIDDMKALGGTNVPEGMAWGWRAVSGAAPFTEGRGDAEKGNDKVVIVLTDGENTYYTQDYFRNPDAAGNRSSYSSLGYVGQEYADSGKTRLFLAASAAIDPDTHSEENYTAAMNEQMATLCGNVKNASVLVMTVALDLNAGNKAQKKQIDALTECSSDSRFSKDASGKPRKLFWNTTGGDLEKTFKEIADELSNLRIVG